jgi:hypothetical protein
MAGIVALAVRNAVSSTEKGTGGCVACGGRIKKTSRGQWRHLIPPKDKHPVRLAPK